MNKTTFDKLDLNLVKVFFVLHEQNNTHKAAEILNMSQPAVSRALQKLRIAFDDPLFVKTRHGLSATNRADELALNLSDIWQQLKKSINHQSTFEPLDLQGKLRCALNPGLLNLLSHPLFMRLHQAAPNLEVITSGWATNTVEELESDKIDFAISVDPVDMPKSISQLPLPTMTAKVYVSKQHPLIHSAITEKAFAKYPLAILHTPGWNEHIAPAERILKSVGITPQILYRGQHPSTVVSVIADTHTLHPTMVEYTGVDTSKVQLKPLLLRGEPIYLQPYFCFHYRHRNDPFYQWLYEIIKEIIGPNSIA